MKKNKSFRLVGKQQLIIRLQCSSKKFLLNEGKPVTDSYPFSPAIDTRKIKMNPKSKDKAVQRNRSGLYLYTYCP